MSLQPEQVHLRTFDVVYDYQMNAQLFGGNGLFVFNSQKVVLAAQNAKGRADGDLLIEVVNRFLRMFAVPEKLMVLFSANAHAKMESTTMRNDYLKRFRFDPRISGPGTVGFVRLDEWPEDVKLLIEPSLGLEDGLFLAWTTKFSAHDLPEISDKFVRIVDSVAGVYGLKIRPLE
jgi:hypothetical protein